MNEENVTRVVSAEIFQRVEKKYVISYAKYTKFSDAIAEYVQMDQYGKSTICNIYYDTEDYELIRTSIEKPLYKEKLRLRCYGIADAAEPAFIEIKKKYEGIVYKRRIQLPLLEAEKYLESGECPSSLVNPQIMAEIGYFLQQYQPKPKICISYDREAFVGKEDPSLRMTFDFHVRARESDLELEKGDSGEVFFENEEVIMEIKVNGAYPLWLSQILSELQIYPSSFSKYGAFYQKKKWRLNYV